VAALSRALRPLIYGRAHIADDALVKILLLGNSSVGKTCLLMRFCEVRRESLLV
jgi:GTP-binding protein EngB required for normal cell division